MTFVSYAQNFEDVMLWRALSTVKDGFYIDVGASEPIADSVTAAFYERGWSGINIEPMAGAYARLAAARSRDINLQLALEEKSGVASYFSVGEGNGISTGVPALGNKYKNENWEVERVPVTIGTLRDVCEKHAQGRAIHFLKVDVEGKERAVLLGGDFARFRPWIILVEATLPNSQTPTHQEWEDLLLSQRYTFVYFDGLNRFYVANEKLDELEAYFHSPPNWFDHFMRASEATALQKSVELDSGKVLLERKLSEVTSELEKTASELNEMDAGWRLEKTAREQLEQRLKDAQTEISALVKSASDRADSCSRLAQNSMQAQEQLAVAKSELDLLRQMQDTLTSQIEAYYQEAFESSRHIAWLSHERVQLSHRLSQSENAQQALAGAHQALVGSHQALVESQQQREELLRSLESELLSQREQHASRLDEVFRTLSWRITRPLRAIRRMLPR
ncbi:FkbM family methyltransferase [Variovorax paradoxus]|uniref:FkbM family methyltransferase n=1 Tax=Variovorax paradoxus TaxID=34073 RepID=UPI00278AD73E|nr:FkbM family methyltransferase [Variovorax paradoxus]MDP9932682.1 FkbM family methyltransferase [Variovorax paradoxus]